MKMFAFDLDKTTLNSRGELSSVNYKILQAMLKKNVILIPATGRNLEGIPNEILGLNIRYAIVSNGAMVIDLLENKIIWQKTLSKAELKQVICMLSKDKIAFTIHTDDKCFDSTIMQVVIRRLLFKNSSVFFPNLKSGIKELDNINKIQLIFLSKKHLQKVYNVLSEIDVIHVVKSSKHCIEITHREANKGNALKFLSDYLGVDRGEIVSIGDNDNDIEMLQFSGTSYVVLNSSDTVKIIADYVVSSNDDHALKDIIY